MAKLTAAARKKIKPGNFALPKTRSKSGGKGGFPIENKSHAQAALKLAPKSEKAGNISASDVAHIRSKVHAKFPNVGKKSSGGFHSIPF